MYLCNLLTKTKQCFYAIFCISLLSVPCAQKLSCHGVAAYFNMKHKAEIAFIHNNKILSARLSAHIKYGFAIQSPGINSGAPIVMALAAKINYMTSINICRLLNINFGLNYMFHLSHEFMKQYFVHLLKCGNAVAALKNTKFFICTKSQITNTISIIGKIQYPLLCATKKNNTVWDIAMDLSLILEYKRKNFSAYASYKLNYNRMYGKSAQKDHIISLGINVYKKHKNHYNLKCYRAYITNRATANLYADFIINPGKYDKLLKSAIKDKVKEIAEMCVKKDSLFMEIIEDNMPLIESGITNIVNRNKEKIIDAFVDCLPSLIDKITPVLKQKIPQIDDACTLLKGAKRHTFLKSLFKSRRSSTKSPATV